MVAYSGGCDSHVLLHALSTLRDAHGLRLRAVHVDHNLQPSSRQWAEHCQRVCDGLRVPCAVERIDVLAVGEESIEAAARRLRYERLRRHVGMGDVLVTAHHVDDQAETVLLALLRGAGVRGLAAMPAITGFGAGRHARPLLEFSRAALTTYAAAHRLHWVEDASNRDEHMSRNFLRAQVLPRLEERWPAATRTLARAAANSAEAATMLDEIAQIDLAKSAGDGGAASLSIVRLSQLSFPRQRNLVRYWIRGNGFHAPSAQHLDRILEQVQHPSRSGIACISWPGTEVRRYRDRLTIAPRVPHPDHDLVLRWQPPQSLDVPATGWRLCVLAAQGEGLSQSRLAASTLTVRLRHGGEVVQLVGREHHHKLKKLFQEAGVPPWERERLPLIYVDDELAAIGDRWVCAPFAAQPDEPGWRIVLEKLS